jgi:hydrogenase-4 component E
MVFGELHAATVVDWVAVGLLGTALAALLARRLETEITLLAVQGALLSVAALAVAQDERTVHAAVSCVLTVAVKLAGVPLLLLWVLQRLHIRHESAPLISRKLGLGLGIVLVFIAYRVAGRLPLTDVYLTGDALPAALGLLLIGLLTMLTRRKALAQVVGLVTMENGLLLAAVVATRGLPTVVEIGVAVDVLSGVTLMVLLGLGMHQNTGRTSTDEFRTLRG